MTNRIITTEMLRSPGERRALILAGGAFCVLLCFFSLATMGLVLMAIATALVVGILAVVLEQGRRRRHSVMVTARQLPRIHGLVQTAAERLTYESPSVYIEQSPVLNAYALGLFGNDTMVLNSALIDGLSEAELCFVIGHELTHVKCGHTFWKIVGGSHPVLKMPGLSVLGSLFLKWWSRKAELTADRGGLIACGDLTAALRALVALAVGTRLAKEVDVDQMVRQSVASDSNLLSTAAVLDSTHPDLGSRIRELLAFARSDVARASIATPVVA